MGRFTTLLFCAFLCLMPATGFAQGVDVGISGVGLLSIQPVDDTYVGGPYLSEGIGGIAPGFGAGIDVVFQERFVAGVEFSTAYYQREQSGRLVGSAPGRTVTTRLRDSVVSGLLGFAISGSRTSVRVRGGPARIIDTPSIDGVEVPEIIGDSYKRQRFAVTGGVDVLRSLSPRTSLVITARYLFTARDENIQYLGIGPHIFRVGGGVRVKLN